MKIISENTERSEWGSIAAFFYEEGQDAARVSVYQEKPGAEVKINWYTQSGSTEADAAKLIELLQAAQEFAKGIK